MFSWWVTLFLKQLSSHIFDSSIYSSYKSASFILSSFIAQKRFNISSPPKMQAESLDAIILLQMEMMPDFEYPSKA